ncbi:uncharacterized protein [Henckelia pumila]|uniref:uncharacterized protein isoform X2 n=1 Tax=Henckelia pumila TaxID=405737 RepID=UPI003C6DFA5A
MPIGAIAHPCLQLYSLAAKPMTQMSELVKERWPSMSEIELAKQKAQDIAARLLNNVDPMKRARVENGAGGGEEMTRVIWKLINEKNIFRLIFGVKLQSLIELV